MQILFLGTGAADWQGPDPASGDFRRRCATLLDGRILLDCGPDVGGALAAFQADAASISDVLLTHSHGDHFSLDTLRFLASTRRAAPRLRLWAHPAALRQAAVLGEAVDLHPIQPDDGFALDGLEVTALAANHQTDEATETALHYFLTTADGRTLLYALDGAWLLKPAWAFLRRRRIDTVVWDCTIGGTAGDWRVFEHNSLEMIRTMTATLRKQGVLQPGSRCILSHLARTLCAPQRELAAGVAADGFTVAFDGMRLDL